METIPNTYELELRRKRLEILSRSKSGRGFSDEGMDNYPELWSDKEIVTEACKSDPGNIERASVELKNNEDFIISLAKMIDFKKFPNYGVGGKGYVVFAQDAGFSLVDALRIERKIKEII